MAITHVGTTTTIVKRDGRVVPFDRSRIEHAIERCFAACKTLPMATPEQVTDHVLLLLRHVPEPWTVELVQDMVEAALMVMATPESARRYIVYREEHAEQRQHRPIPPEVQAAYDSDGQFFPTPLQRFQFVDKYSRWNSDLGRRETWVETVDRAVDYLAELSDYSLGADTYDWIARGIREMRAMPSMRLLAMAGAPARRDNTTIYNCAYLPIDDLQAFPEILSISMAGGGVGWSVERDYVNKLPLVQRQQAGGKKLHIVEDSAEGWSEALEVGLTHWVQGYDVDFNYSLIRPNGAILRTKGGRASGYQPLERMLDFTRGRILARQGGSLRPIDAYDIACMVGNAAVSGGVRRTAMIALFDEDDAEMLAAKSGDFEQLNNQRWNANNSAVWTNTAQMDQLTFIDRFADMVRVGRGEPGIFSRVAALAMMPPRRDKGHKFGSNPCGEIVLRPFEFCNLTAIVARHGDTLETLSEKARLAATIGTIQSNATFFPNLRPMWKQNCEEERLLGVDITGQTDCGLLTGTSGAYVMRELRSVVLEQNIHVARRMGINPSVATTCVKPSGNTSQLLDCSSGLHPRWAKYYIRNVRVSASSPVAKALLDAGAPMEPENGDDPHNPRTWVASFPVKAPEGAITRHDWGAIQQCDYWLKNKLHWTEHNPSVTITYRPDEVIDLMAWVWGHRDRIGGMAFLPVHDAKYGRLPYIEIEQEEYEQRAAAFPDVDYAKVYRHEIEDQTVAAQELACVTGLCEIGDDIGS